MLSSSFFARNLKRSYPMVESASGVWITDTTGRQFLDGCSGAVVANLGHGVVEIAEAVKSQLDKVAFAHTSQFISQPGLQLAERLIGLAPSNFHEGGRAYFVSGGSEAVETALKMARSFFLERDKTTSKHLVVSRWNSYHGGTFGAMQVTGHPARRKPYLPMLKDQPHISPAYPYRCPCQSTSTCTSERCGRQIADELESAILHYGAENVLAFIAEPVVGAALGAVSAHPGYWTRIEEICRTHDVLFIADEVMTGLGRCGANFAVDLFDVQPDIIVAGKGLAAGYMPLAAVLASKRIVDAFLAGSGVFEHGFTYSGHPLSCAAGLAAVDMLVGKRLVAEVAGRSADFHLRLKALQDRFEIVGDARSVGFLGALELVQNRAGKTPFAPAQMIHRKLADAALEQGLLIYPGTGFVADRAGDHVMVAPPFNITNNEMDTLFERLDAALNAVSKQILISV
jgi:adenosylmethionine-8-amino-7-oxononanoate aminotransferase